MICKCGCNNPIERHSYETDSQWEKRKASGLFRAKCKKNWPFPTERPKPSLDLLSANYLAELRAVEKERPVRDLARLAFARSMPCCLCGAIEGIQAHHESEEGKGCLSGKTSDRRTIPLCPTCHMMRHAKGREWFKNIDIGRELEKVIQQINEAYDNFKLSH
jgi:hypothetical protein